MADPIPNRREALGIKAVSWFHRIAYSLTGGRLLGVVAGAPVLLLTTTGLRTGKHALAVLDGGRGLRGRRVIRGEAFRPGLGSKSSVPPGRANPSE